MIRWLASLAILAACSELPPITAGVCGNGVIESQEDCDHTNDKCIDCRWECTDQLCPEVPGYRCGADTFCHGPSGDFAQTPADSVPFSVIGFRITDVDRDGYGDVVGLNATALNVRYGDPTGELPDSYNVVTPQIQGNPIATHLVSEDVDDLVLPAADGLVVYTGAFGVPSPRQFPLNGDEGPENMGGRPDPFDAVQIDDTIGLFGPDSTGANQKAMFGLIRLTARGPSFDVETADLCGVNATSFMLWQQDRISSYVASSGTFVAFTNGAMTCVIEVSKAASPIPRAPPPSTCPQRGPNEADCEYQVRSVRAFTNIARRPVFADLNGDGCPSLIVHDNGLSRVVEYPGTVSMNGCVIADQPNQVELAFKNEPPMSDLIGSVKLVPAVANMAPDALISAYGIHSVPPAPQPNTTPWRTEQMYISDRPLRRAVVGDIDSDGALDVVFSTFLPNLDIARRVPSQNAFLLVRTPTSGAVVQTMIADYDGDLRDDLAYVEALGEAQRLSIAYGTPTGLGDGIAADAFKRVEFMSAMQVRDSTDPFGLVDDLIVIDIITIGQPEITILHGSPSRTMLSFFGLPVPVLGAAFRGVVAGDFIDSTPNVVNPAMPDERSTGITDLVAFQTYRAGDPACALTGCRTAIWVAPGLPNARLGAVQFVSESSVTMEPVLPGTQLIDDCRNGPTAEFCIEGSIMVAWPVSDDHDIVIGVDVRITSEGVVQSPHILRFDPAVAWSETPSPIATNVFPARGLLNELSVFDVDHDGQEELVAAFSASVASRADGHVSICPMNRDGTFAGACRDVATEILGDDTLECVDAWAGRVLPVCEGESGMVPRLAVLCRKSFENAELMVTSWQSFVIPLVTGADGTPTGGLPILTTAGKLDEFQIGDVTGDAVDDIVALDILLGTPYLQVFPQSDTIAFDTCSPDDDN